jgi:ABC-type glycerol-3-phosphate transport system substrate-binding protein
MNVGRYRRRTLAGVAALAAVSLVLVACGNSGSGSGSTSAAGAAASSITVWTAIGPDYDWQKAQLAAFTRQTGIKVNYQGYPETSFTDKLTTAQQAKSSAFSIFESPQSSTSQYNAYHGIQSLSAFLKSAPATYLRAGIPAGETGQCTLNGTTYCLPVQLDGGPQMFYNKAMFAAAHITTPPSSWSQVVADAAKLTTSAHAGICMRGSEAAPNGYPVLLMLPYYLPYSTANKGEYLSPAWKPLFSTPQAVTWAKDYSTLMTKYAPKGVGAYDYTDCVHAFQTGKVAMFWDDASLGAELWDPAQAATAKDAGFAEIPCPPSNQTCLLSAPWGMYINPNVPAAEQRAAWKYLEFMTSPATQLAALKQSKNPDVATRPATLTYAIAHSGSFGIPADYLTSLRYGIQHIEDNAIPVTAAFSAVQSQLFVILSEMIGGQLSPAAAASQLQSQMTSTLHRFNLGS